MVMKNEDVITYSSTFGEKWTAQLRLVRHLHQGQEYTLDQYQEFDTTMQSLLERGELDAVTKEWRRLFRLFRNPVVVEHCWDLLKIPFQRKSLEVTYLKKLGDMEPFVSLRIIFCS